MLSRCFVALTTLSTCSETLEDVSARGEYKEIVGARYEVVGKLEAYGIGRNPYEQIDYVKLMPVFGYTRSEVGFNIPVRQGSKLTITNVYHSNRWFDRGVTLGVRLEGMPLPVDAPVRIDLRDNVEDGGHVSLNLVIFKRI